MKQIRSLIFISLRVSNFVLNVLNNSKSKSLRILNSVEANVCTYLRLPFSSSPSTLRYVCRSILDSAAHICNSLADALPSAA